MTAVKRYLYWLLYPLFILACARQTTPTGGPKDTLPPTLIRDLSIPKQGQTNYKGKEIQLSFSETIILNNPKEQLIITPDIQKKYDIVAKKNRVTITLENELQDSTTYAFTFRNAVQDITEKNPAKNLKLAFSTGPYIDSLSIRGKIVEPLTQKIPKEATVAVFQQDTFNIFTDKPSYLTQTDDKGNFSLENLKPGKYSIYAIEDKNKNLLVDSKNEAYAFNSDTINLNANVTSAILRLQKLDARPLKLISAKPYGTYFNIKTTKNLVSYSIKSTKQSFIASAFGDDQSSIRVFNNLGIDDSLAINFAGTDSIDNKLDTILYLKFSKRKSKPEQFIAKTQGFELTATKSILKGKILFNKPLSKINTDSIYYQVDSLTTIFFTTADFSYDTLHNILSLKKTVDKNIFPKPPEKISKGNPKQTEPTQAPTKAPIYKLHINRATFISIENDSSERIDEPAIKPLYYEDTGIITADIQTKETNYIVQLLDNNFKILRSTTNTSRVIFDDLKPGDYQIRLVIDKNGDKEWTPGNFYTKTEVEPTTFYYDKKANAIIRLKANFELGPLLITY